MISDWETWSCAQLVLKEHGAKADAFVASRVAELVRKGDAEGVAMWRAIAGRIDQLRDFKGAGHSRH